MALWRVPIEGPAGEDHVFIAAEDEASAIERARTFARAWGARPVGDPVNVAERPQAPELPAAPPLPEAPAPWRPPSS